MLCLWVCSAAALAEVAALALYISAVKRYSRWRQLCMHAQPCMQGWGEAACLLCMVVAVCSHVLGLQESLVGCTGLMSGICILACCYPCVLQSEGDFSSHAVAGGWFKYCVQR
jgi:hypothetical protein